MKQIDVQLDRDAYSINIGQGLLRELGRTTMNAAPHKRAFMVVDANIASTHGAVAVQSLKFHGYEVAMHAITADEQQKSLETMQHLYEAMLSARLDRRSPVIALGGGMIGDVAGFAAATYMRGLPLIQVPTTLLAMVDASIGGKTGVNFAQTPAPVKNLIGAFWQPVAVIIDPEVLRTLEPREFNCGLAECVKHALIADPDLLSFIAEHVDAIRGLDMNAIEELIERSARIKAAIVTEDERENGRRALLNLGHTFAHAIEPIAELDLKHGEAVSVGLVAAMRCATVIGRLESGVDALVADLLELLDLPIALPAPVPVARLLEAMRFDKKVSHDRLRLILPSAIGEVEIVEQVPQQAIEQAWLSVGASAEGADGSGHAVPHSQPQRDVFDTTPDATRLAREG